LTTEKENEMQTHMRVPVALLQEIVDSLRDSAVHYANAAHVEADETVRGNLRESVREDTRIATEVQKYLDKAAKN
jgi:hypothetical protein